MPAAANWGMMAGGAALGGIGFTVSLFIANLSFDAATPAGSALLDMAKLGIVIGSVIAAGAGMTLLSATLPKAPGKED